MPQNQSGVAPTPRAVFFDFDGTLVDSYEAITASVNYVRAHHGMLPLSEPEVRRFVGRGPAYLLTHTVPGGELSEDVKRYRAHHPSVLHSGTRLLPGAAEAVTALKKAGLLLGVCSNKPRDFTRELVRHLRLDPWLDVVLGPEDVARLKPAPDMLLAGMRQLGVSPAESLYVGDMVVDVETARGAGVRVWVVPTGSEERAALEAAKPDRILDGLTDLIELVR